MSVSATVVVCALAVLSFASAAPAEDKKLRHVIITGFGEMPYEPLEGFYQSDVVPVNFQDKEKNPTMDVALSTGILVEDPNEKKEENSAEDDGQKLSGEEQFRLFREKYRYAPKGGVKQAFGGAKGKWSVQITDDSAMKPSFGYDVSSRYRKEVSPAARSVDSNGYNIDKEYNGDLGEGWNLQDAEDVLQNRNINEPQAPSVSNNFPSPPSREVPPPPPPPGARRPFFPFSVPAAGLPFPPPGYGPVRRPKVFPPFAGYGGDVVYGRVDPKNPPAPRSIDRVFSSEFTDSDVSRARYGRQVFHSADPLSGL